jgi:hypothetical protein
VYQVIDAMRRYDFWPVELSQKPRREIAKLGA